MAKKSSIVLEADPGDPEDFPVDRAALDRAHMGRRIRRLRNRLRLTQEGFAERYGLRLCHLPVRNRTDHAAPAVRAYLTVIEREPEMAARALHPDAAWADAANLRAQRGLGQHPGSALNCAVGSHCLFGDISGSSLPKCESFCYCSPSFCNSGEPMRTSRPTDLVSAANRLWPVSDAINRVNAIAPVPLLPGEEADYAILLRVSSGPRNRRTRSKSF